MQKRILLFFGSVLLAGSVSAQGVDSTKVYKKKVLENTEVDFLMSLYNQDGVHSPVNGGIGTEKLVDGTPTVVLSVPLNADDVLTVDAGISAYTSASSSNINPFVSGPALKSGYLGSPISATGASRGGTTTTTTTGGSGQTVTYPTNPVGTPWLSSTGASRADKLKALSTSYSHSSDDRNTLWGSNVYLSKEFDYTSFGLGGHLTGLYNEKNTEIGLKGTVFLDQWKPIYPTELKQYQEYGTFFQYFGYLYGVTIRDQSGAASTAYLPSHFKPWTSNARDSYTLSFYGSQILSQRLQVALFFDLVYQKGMLSTPYHRTYFKDLPHYYIGLPGYISTYTTPANTGVYMLADAIESLPQNRFKIPIGMRLNYYLNETFVLRTYYRYYLDDWGLKAHTVNVDLPIRFSQAFSLTPSYRYYTQNQVDYFGPFMSHLSTEKYFTSDYDLSQFVSKQYSLALSYTDILSGMKKGKLGFKNLNLKYSHFDRSDGLKANIISIGVKFIGGE